jgi:hypothetical protein
MAVVRDITKIGLNSGKIIKEKFIGIHYCGKHAGIIG